MKIAWFTPLSKKSAIGRASASIAREPGKLSELEVWHCDTGPLHAVEAETTFYRNARDPILSRLAAFDLVFYNFGNHLPFHREIFLTAVQHPGVVILHDFVMHHFFSAYYLEELQDPEQYRAALEKMYGAKGLAADRRRVRGKPIWETDEVALFPMFESIPRGALGIVVHSEFFFEKVDALRAAPACRISLPYEIPVAEVHGGPESLGVPSGRLVALMLGHINSNKRAEALIEAIGGDSRLAAAYHCLIAGPCDSNYRRKLEALIQKNGLRDRVQFLGYVSDGKLQALLTHADICVNLRYPAMEGASASVIEEMLYGKPVVVSDTGFFSELPSDTVVKIRPLQEQADLREALSALLDAPFRTGLGRRARHFAESAFRADRYAKEILRFAWEVRSAKPLLKLADRISSEFLRMGITPDMALVESVSETSAALFLPPQAAKD